MARSPLIARDPLLVSNDAFVKKQGIGGLTGVISNFAGTAIFGFGFSGDVRQGRSALQYGARRTARKGQWFVGETLWISTFRRDEGERSVDCMSGATVRKPARYLIELSAPEAGWQDIDRLIQRARFSANGSGSDVRFIRAIFVPEDSTCLLLYEADSARAAAAAAAAAGLLVERVSQAVHAAIPIDREEHRGT